MSSPHQYTVIGNPKGNFWLHSTLNGFDLTHPSSPTSAPVYPRVCLNTTTEKIAIDPSKSALVIIDMQNLFLSPGLGRSRTSNGLKACDQLLAHAIPACRKAGIRIVWLNWGLTQEDIDHMPPSTLRAFASNRDPRNSSAGSDAAEAGLVSALGKDMGSVTLDDGSTVQAGNLLMRNQWNTQLYESLEQARQEGLNGKCAVEDVWIHKNRMSGLWGSGSPCTEYLDGAGIKTLLFAGVNTDQCVGGSLADAFVKGYDCILLNDASGTTTPGGQEVTEINTANFLGFTIATCAGFAKNVNDMEWSS